MLPPKSSIHELLHLGEQVLYFHTIPKVAKYAIRLISKLTVPSQAPVH